MEILAVLLVIAVVASFAVPIIRSVRSEMRYQRAKTAALKIAEAMRMEAHDFSRRMHGIEDALGRVRTVRNGPRTIDIDLIDFDGLVLDEPELTLPHPRAAERDFVLRPLAELGIALPKNPESGR